jgi:ubiquinone/menaquinone biosynthesis C-methylase UbiE
MGLATKTDKTQGGKEVGRYFDRRAPHYRAATSHGLWAWQRHREARAVLELAGAVTDRAALDMGCGAGFYADQLAARGAMPVVAIDLSEQMLEQIKDPRIETVTGDAATIALAQRFDLIIIAGVLEFAAEPISVLVNARRHLADGGRIVVLFPPDSVAGRLYRLYHRSHGLNISLFDRKSIGSLATAAGLHQTARSGAWPLALVSALEIR